MRILLIGPTAVGKTETALLLAEQLQTPIISVDSRQCYAHLDIGTAKPTQRELNRVKHFNISILNPDEKDTVADFSKRASNWEQEVLRTSQHTLYTGGSTLHLQSLLCPLDDIPSSNSANLELLQQQADDEGLESLYSRLKDVDPVYAGQMDGPNRQRMIRALDVWMQTGKPFSSFHQREEFSLPENTIVFGLKRDRQVLYDRINHRVDTMIEQGLLQELDNILEQGFSAEAQALQTVGYRELIDFKSGQIKDLEHAIEKIKTNTRRYAKRQITWFKRWPFVTWLNADQKKPQELVEIMQRDLAAMQKKG